MKVMKVCVMVLATIMVLLLQGIWCSADCWETERIALLQLQSHLNYSLQDDQFFSSYYSLYYDSISFFYDYYTSSPKIDVIKCCDWERVRCSATTGYITQLNFENIRYFSAGIWYLNASLFLPFQHLNYLNLRYNQIAGCLKNEGFERLSSLENLEFLNLGFNNFNNDILSSLIHLSSLKYLYLYGNDMKGRINIEELNSLTNLKSLSIGSNKIEGFKTFNSGEEFLLNMSNLQFLDIGDNHIGNDVLSTLRGLSSLKTLWMNSNQLKGTFDLKELDTMSNLEKLGLDRNNITKFIGLREMRSVRNLRALFLRDIMTIKGSSTLLESLGALTHLEFLDLSGSNFEGATLSLGVFTNLETLDMSRSDLKGTKFTQDSNLTNLKELYLYDSSMDGNFFQNLEALHSLEILSMWDCKFSGIIPVNQGMGSLRNLRALYLRGISIKGRSMLLESLGAMAHLEILDLSESNFEGTILSFEALNNLKTLSINSSNFEGTTLLMGASTHLKTLAMTDSNLKGTKFAQGSNVSNLRELYLDYSSVDRDFLWSLGALPSLELLSLIHSKCTLPIQGLPHLKNLEQLYLDDSTVHGNFLQAVGVLSSLKILSLPNCGLSGIIPVNQGICELNHLQMLDISNNDLIGNLPSCLANLTSLQLLDLSSNHFVANISSSPLKSLTALHYLYLSNNFFQIPISLSPFFNHSKLRHLESTMGSEMYGETDDQNLNPRFQLERLILSSGGYGGAFPKFLYHQHDLQFVDLSHIQMSEGFPYWMLQNNTKLKKLYLINNSLSGPLQLPLQYSHMNLSELDISNNCLSGFIAPEIGTYLPRLTYVNMSRNGLTGSIPSSFGNMSLLRSLDLSNNRLSNLVPKDLTMGCVLLHELILSNNNLQGQIFGNMSLLESLDLSTNNFSGSIPSSLSKCHKLRIMDISYNHLTGKIPIWIRNMSSLQILDLSQNRISGNLPSNFCPTDITEVHLSKNKLQGLLMDSFSNCYSLVVLDLSHNNLIGRIPKWIGEIPLGYILLSHNHFEGEIPFQLCKLDKLSLIDLSHNNLSGLIPYCLRCSSNYWYRQQEALLNPPTPALAPIPASAPIPGFYVGSPDIQPEQPVEFTTKNSSYFYQPSILHYFSGIDLSCNNLAGEIPPELGNLDMIKVLNLSHNKLIGAIPPTFSNLRQIESLDLSYNNLQGRIPSQLTQLYSLAVFNVAHNNLSGKAPERVAQFATFDQSSYEGNPLLCGLPLPKSCNNTSPSPPVTPTEEKEDNGFMDMGVFYVSFVVSYIMVLLAIAAVLYINPYWRRRWFYFIETSLTNCYYFLVDNIPLLSKFGLS